jgi:large subunit ribosomal protein L15
VTPEALVEKGLVRNTRFDVKVLGGGELTKKLTITVHRASASAREKIEGAGGSLTLLRDPDQPKKRRKAKKTAEVAPELGEPAGDEVAPEGEG